MTKPYRGKAEMVHCILDYCKSNRIISDISRHCNMSHYIAEGIVNQLMDSGMIEQTHDETNRGFKTKMYTATPFGRVCLEKLDLVLQLFCNFKF